MVSGRPRRADTTHGRQESSSPGSRPMPTAWTTWTGCAGPTASSARRAGMPAGWAVADGRYKCSGLRRADVGNGRHAVRPPADAAHGVVHGLLDVRRAEGRRLGAEPAAGAGDGLVPDGVGDAAPAALGAGASGPRPADRHGRGGRDLHRRRGSRGCPAGGPRARKPWSAWLSRSRSRADMAVAGWRSSPTGPPPPCTRSSPSNVEPGATGRHRRLAGLRRASTSSATRHDPRSQRAARARGEDPGELLPGVHRVASLAKRWLLGTHQGSVDEAHLQSYLNEFVFRFNRRAIPEPRDCSSTACSNSPSATIRCATATWSPTHGPSEATHAARRRGHPPSIDRPSAARPWRAS